MKRYLREARSQCQPFPTSIIAIPAVGADPQITWGSGDDQWLLELHKEIPNTILLQYDHLTDSERRSFETAAGPRDLEDDASANTLERLKDFKVEDWSNRFLQTLEKERFVKSVCLKTALLMVSLVTRQPNANIEN